MGSNDYPWLRNEEHHIDVLLGASSWAEGKLYRSNGTVEANPHIYEPAARIPHDLWKPVLHRFRAAGTDYKWVPGHCLYFGRLPPPILQKIREREPFLNEGTYSSPSSQENVREVIGYLSESIHFQGTMKYLGVSRDSPGKFTVSRNQATDKLVGLHVDDWDKLAIADKDLALNRVAINVGLGQRSFLFIPIRASKMVELISAAGSEPRPVLANGRQLMETYPDLCVFRFILDPGDFYIAPTDNLIHDGSTQGLDGSLSLVIRGTISPKYLEGAVLLQP